LLYIKSKTYPMRSHYEYKLVGFNIYCTVAKYNTKTINQ
jgi:hypothetical protein